MVKALLRQTRKATIVLNTLDYSRGFAYCLFDDLKTGLDFHCGSQRCRYATVLGVGEFDCVCNCFRGDRAAGQDVMDLHRSETSRIVIAALSRNLDDVARHLL